MPKTTPKTITIKVTITDEQKAAMEAFAAKKYRPELGITWKTVAAGWAQGAFETYLKEYMERTAEGGEHA